MAPWPRNGWSMTTGNGKTRTARSLLRSGRQHGSGGAAAGTVERDGEAVGLVADPHQQVQHRVVGREVERIFSAGQEHPLPEDLLPAADPLLREGNERNVLPPGGAHRRRRGG